MFLRPGGEGGASHLFFSLEDELHVMLQQALLEQVLEGLQVHEQLTFIVVRAAGVDGLFAGGRVLGEDGLEGAGAPLVERLRRLDVVVAVDEHRLLGAGHGLGAEDDGVAGGLIDGGLVGPGGGEELRQPACAAIHIGLILRLGADGGDTQEGEKFFKETFAVLVDIGFHLVSRFYKISKKSQNRAQFRE